MDDETKRELARTEVNLRAAAEWAIAEKNPIALALVELCKLAIVALREEV